MIKKYVTNKNYKTDLYFVTLTHRMTVELPWRGGCTYPGTFIGSLHKFLLLLMVRVLLLLLLSLSSSNVGRGWQRGPGSSVRRSDSNGGGVISGCSVTGWRLTCRSESARGCGGGGATGNGCGSSSVGGDVCEATVRDGCTTRSNKGSVWGAFYLFFLLKPRVGVVSGTDAAVQK